MKHLRSCSALCAVALALSACTTPAPAQQALKVDPDTGQLVEPTTLRIGSNQTFTVASDATLTLPASLTLGSSTLGPGVVSLYDPFSDALSSYSILADRPYFTAAATEYEIALSQFTQPAPTIAGGASIQGQLNAAYVFTSTGSIIDPAPEEGKGFSAFIRNGTATLGGTSYSTPGTMIRRIYLSGSWQNYEYKSFGGNLTITPYSGSTTISPSQSGIGWADAGRFTVQTPVGALQFYYTGSPSEAVIYWPGRIVTTNFESVSITGSVSASLLSGGSISPSVLSVSYGDPFLDWQDGSSYAGAAGLTYVTDTDVGFSQLEPTIGVWYPQINVVAGGSTDLNRMRGRYRSLTQYLSDLGRLTATASLDFPSIAAGAQSTLTITLTGAVVNDSIMLGLPSAPAAGLVFNAYVSAADTVTVRASNISASAVDAASATYRVTKF